MLCTAKAGAHAGLPTVCFALLAACSGGGDSGYCSGGFGGGETLANATACSGCSVQSAADAIDDSAGSASKLVFVPGGGQITLRATAPGDDTFPSGTNPGALMQFPEINLVNSGVSFTLYNNGVVVSSASGGAQVSNGVVPGAGSKHYYDEASTPLEFDAVEAQVTISGNTDPLTVSVYEICGDN